MLGVREFGEEILGEEADGSSDDVQVGRSVMKVPMSVLKLMAGVPVVVASTVLWVIVFALAPPVVGLLGFLAGVVALVLLATGVGEVAAAWRSDDC